MSKVAIVPCQSYDGEEVLSAVREGVGLLGGMSSFVRPEDRVLLKPNLLRRAAPDQGITTHPSVFEAVGRLVREAGCRQVKWGDSPGGVNPSAARVGGAAGIAGAADRLGIPLADFTKGVDTPFPQGRAAKEFSICPGALEADAILNLCKMKTHALERITGAVKNTFGVIHGAVKAADHVKYPDPDSFAEMLADLNRLIVPRLHIMDGVMAMEGNGPAGGTLVQMGVLLFSQDPVALDAVFCRLIHLSPLLVPTNVRGRTAGIGTWREEEIQLLAPDGELSMAQAVERWGNPDFDVQRTGTGLGPLTRGAASLRTFGPRPVIREDKCVKCGVCVESCPVEGKAIHQPDPGAIPRYEYAKCIRCFCCQELCPAHAIEVRERGQWQ